MEREALLAGVVQPGGREPAPGALRLVQAFVNTVDREHGPDLLADAAGFDEWLRRHGLVAPLEGDATDRGAGAALVAPLEGDATDRGAGAALVAARELREALRALLLANNGHGVASDGALVAAARRARLEPAFDPPALVPRADGADGALGRIVAAAFAAMLDGSWRRLKACPRDECGWAFYDRSSNASATWCSMQVCGGRVKAGAYYRRRRAAGP